MSRRWICLHCLIVGICVTLLVPSPIHARCTVSTTSINFGTYDVLSPVPDTGTGSITLSCSSKANVTIAIGASSVSGLFYPRRMENTAFFETLDYNLYDSPAMIQVWGDGTNGTITAAVFDVRNNNTAPIRIYGKINPQQNVPAGSYSDQLVITVIY